MHPKVKMEELFPKTKIKKLVICIYMQNKMSRQAWRKHETYLFRTRLFL